MKKLHTKFNQSLSIDGQLIAATIEITAEVADDVCFGHKIRALCSDGRDITTVLSLEHPSIYKELQREARSRLRSGTAAPHDNRLHVRMRPASSF